MLLGDIGSELRLLIGGREKKGGDYEWGEKKKKKKVPVTETRLLELSVYLTPYPLSTPDSRTYVARLPHLQ